MTSKILTDPDIHALKRQAKKHKRQWQCSHMQALDAVARAEGFDNWHQVLKCAERTARLLSFEQASTSQRALIDTSLYTSVPVGWLMGRKSHPDFSLANHAESSDASNELEVPSAQWRGEKHG